MKAAVCRSFGRPLTIEDLSLRAPGPGEVLVDVAAVAVCHSDISLLDGAWGGSLPAVYGHEAAGTVGEAGPGVANVDRGDRVVVTLVRSCGECRFCQKGMQVACERSFDIPPPLTDAAGRVVHRALGTGAFAEQVVVHHSQVVPIAAEIEFEAASLLGCGVITGVGAVRNTARVEPGSHVVVVGAGGVGLNAIQGARLAGAASVTAVDVIDGKLTAAQTFGATHTALASGDVAAAVANATGGDMADYVFVTVGAKRAFEQAFGLMATGGAVVLVGMAPDGVTAEFDPTMIAHRNQRILGSKMGTSTVAEDISRLADLYRDGALLLDELITARYLLEGINEAIAAVKAGTALRNVIVFE